MRKEETAMPLFCYKHRGIFLVVMVLSILTTNVHGADLKEKQVDAKDEGVYNHRILDNRDESTVICGDFRVTAFSDYIVRHNLRDTVRQYFEITDLTNGEKKIVFATTMAKLDGYDKRYWIDHKEQFKKKFQDDFWLDGTAFQWICFQGNTEYYLAIEYGTGGNCENCEWVEIMNRNGEIVDRSVKNRRQDNYVQYEQTLKRLDLPKLYVRTLLNFNNPIQYQRGVINKRVKNK